jgi:anti-sigma B factor antagonist
MPVAKKMIQDVAVVTPKGKLMGGPETMEIHESVKELVSEGVTKIVLDMSKVKWLNSVGLGMIMASRTTLSNAGGELKLAALDDKARGLFAISKLDSIFKTYVSADRAAADF